MDKNSPNSSTYLGDTPSVKSSNDEFKINEMYSMKNNSRNLAIIFCHEKFEHEDPRIGVDNDRIKLKSVLEGLNFQVNIFQDKKRQEIFDILNEVAEMDHSNNNCLLIAVMSHGGPGTLEAYDKSYEISVFWQIFSEHYCPTLKGKPKLIFIQSCRGKAVDSGINMVCQENAFLNPTSSNYSSPDSKLYKLEKEEIDLLLHPTKPDFLIGYATIPGYLAYTNEDGSWFIQQICTIFERYGKKYDLLTLLTIVSQRVAVDYISYNKDKLKCDNKTQIPCIVSTLAKRLYFFPKLAEEVPVEKSMPSKL